MEIVRLTKSGLKKDIESGIKRIDMATKYGLPLIQLNKAIDQAGLKGVRAKTIRFELVDDEQEAMQEEVQQESLGTAEMTTPTAPSMY